MPGIAVCNIDSAGGTIRPSGNSTGFYKGNPIAVLGDPVDGHGRSPHNSANMVQASTKAFIKGVPIVLQGMSASCGHTATGRPDATSSG
ncbi:PAAR domain-containing protein [Pseudomonas aeruginosa]|uniref:Uncharacterized protein n=2 Tax=root TaxID=1 RepID=A0A5C1K7R4_9CAUD|nr:hypothetical protein PP933_gp191 [Pseudomonas phage vB_PaeM_PS119XW]MBW6072567.1 PAAR domain-containing protein [Pseudomonas aeruginosa]QBX32346.1 hypothetical protein [Pseudomonas phage PA1C]QEM41920.1 hypothetical protein [Pseudomonas phage vB_PaeM_PS119XW]BEG72436.1 hypothetical protein RVBP21_0640 [Pseudomonas phage BRkr]